MFSNQTGQAYSSGNPQRVEPSQVNEYTIDSFGITVDAVKEQMFGMNVVDPITGKALPDSYYKSAIKSAVAWAEKRFDIKILPRFVVEEKDFNFNEANSYLYQRLLQRPILQVESFNVNMNGTGYIDFPSRWWKVESLGGTIQIMPGYGMQFANFYADPYSSDMQMGASLSYNVLPYGQNGVTSPQAFHVNYIAGMLPQAREGVEEVWEMPEDLKWVLLKEAVKDVLQIWARLILSPGIASQSLSIDGISEQKTSTASAMYNGARSDIIQLNEDIEYLSKGLDAKFGLRITMI